MRGLLLKELELNAKIWWFYLPLLFLAYLLMNADASGFMHAIGVGIIRYSFLIMIFAATGEDDRKCDKYFACLPYSRFQLLLSKYINLAFIPVFILLLDFIFLRNCISFFSAFIAVPAFVALPLCFWKGGKEGSGYGGVVAMFISTILGVIFSDDYKFNRGIPIFLVSLVLLWFCSFLLSVHFYKKRDI